MNRPVLWVAGLGLLLLTRNTMTSFSEKLDYKESISLFLQTVAVLILALYVIHGTLFMETAVEIKEAEVSDSAEQVQSRILTYIQSQNRAKKHVTLEENLSSRWKMSKNVIRKVELFSEYILRDFVRYWYYSVTNDDCVVNDIELCLGNAFGMLLMRGRLGLNPITFGFDKCFQSLVRMLSIHREGKDAATEKLTRSGASAPSEYEALTMFRRAVAEEVRQRRHLHPMFYLPVEWDEKVSGHFKGGDPGKLSEADFFNSQRLKACEAKYYQYLGKHLTKVLLVDKDDVNCKVVRHLITELLANCLLYPIFSLFTPLVVNQWVAYALTPVVSPEETGSGNVQDQGTVSNKEPVLMEDCSPPPGFVADRCWAFFKAGVTERAVSRSLCEHPTGTYIIISLNNKDLFCMLCVFQNQNTDEKGLYHVPFVGYTTDPTGFQICLLSAEEYFPVSVGPPSAIELLNGSLFVTLEQLVTALSSIATMGCSLNENSPSGGKSDEALGGVDDHAAGGESNEKNGDNMREADEQSEQSKDDFETREERVLSHVEVVVDDKELWAEQERLVMLYELQGAVEEFQDALRFCGAQRKPSTGFGAWNGGTKRPHDERPLVNIYGDKTAIRALKRFILCLEDIIFHGYSVDTDALVESTEECRIDSVMFETPGSSPIFTSMKGLPGAVSENSLLAGSPASSKKSGFSLKTIVKRAMKVKKATDSETVIADGSEPPQHYRRLSLRTSSAIDGMLNLLDKRFAFNWFWLEVLRSSSMLPAEKGEGGIVSSASAKLRRFSNTSKDRRDDPTPVVHRLYNSWMDLFSSHLLLSIEDCQQEVIASDAAFRSCSAVDKNCLRVFLYDSLVQGRLVERVNRIIRIARGDVAVESEGDEFIIPSFYTPSAVRGQWNTHAVLMNHVDAEKLLSALAPLVNAVVVLPSSCTPEASREISESPDDNNGGAGLMSFINSASLLNAFSDISLRGADGEAGHTEGPKSKQRDENMAFTRRLRSRRQSVEQAWGHRMSLEESKRGPPLSSVSASKRTSTLSKVGKASLAKVGTLLSKGSEPSAEASVDLLPAPGSPLHTKLTISGEGSDSAASDDDYVGTFQSTETSRGITTPERPTELNSVRASTQVNFRRQELEFKLEMLISGRPSLQNLIELKIWMPTSKTFEVTVSRAEVEDDPTGLTIAGSSMQQVVVYSLTVVSRDTYAGTGDETETWVIRKRYSDFDDLNKQFKLYVSNRVMLHLPLPQKQYINVGGMGSGSASFVEKRRQRLQDYMDCVLRFLSSCDEVRKFLACDSFCDGNADPSVLAKAVQVRQTEHSMRQSVLDEIRSGKGKSPDKREVAISMDAPLAAGIEKTTSRDPGAGRGEVFNTEDDFFIRGVASAELDSRTMRVLEARVYDLIKEVLDVDSMNVVRRNFVSLLRQSVRLFFSTTLKTWASAQAKESVSDANLTWLLDYVLQTVWPGGELIKSSYVSMGEKEEEAELQKLRRNNAAELLSRLPAGLLSNSLGDGQIDKAVDKLFDLLENPFLLKSFVFILIDMLFIEIFPELRPFLSGMDTLRKD